MKSAALLFGLNYQHLPDGQLSGCINDVNNVATFLEQKLQIPATMIEKYTDDINLRDTSYKGILQHLYQFAIRTWKEDLDFVWIHYSGHGSSVIDTNNDEVDGRDETLCPSDCHISGDITDDIVCDVLKSFNPKTVVVLVIDACHSGTMGDLRYTWDAVEKKCVVSGKEHKGHILLLSGCMDQQTSADANFQSKPAGALTYCLLQVLSNVAMHQDIFKMVETLRKLLSHRGFSQVPQLCSSTDLTLPGAPKWFIPTDQDLTTMVTPPTITGEAPITAPPSSNAFKRCFGC